MVGETEFSGIKGEPYGGIRSRFCTIIFDQLLDEYSTLTFVVPLNRMATVLETLNEYFMRSLFHTMCILLAKMNLQF